MSNGPVFFQIFSFVKKVMYFWVNNAVIGQICPDIFVVSVLPSSIPAQGWVTVNLSLSGLVGFQYTTSRGVQNSESGARGLQRCEDRTVREH